MCIAWTTGKADRKILEAFEMAETGNASSKMGR